MRTMLRAAAGLLAALLAGSGAAQPASPVVLEAGFLRDDNANRAPDGSGTRADDVLGVGVSTTRALPLTRHTRVLLAPFAEAEKHSENELDRLSVGARADLQYRSSGRFDAPTVGLFLRATVDEYASALRSGTRLGVGAAYRQAITDRIEISAELARDARSAEHAVFDTKDTSARLQADYRLTGRTTLYAGAEVRRGDAVSSVPQGFDGTVQTRAGTPDDAFGGLYAYRYDARTEIWSLGLNWPLGTHDALDLSLQRVEAEPREPFPSYGGTRYRASQLSVFYLRRF